jgi:hypothetical protein
MALPQVQGYRAQVSGVPGAVTPQVSFGQQVRADTAVQAQAQYQNTLSQVLDRLSSKVFGMAETLADQEGWQFALNNRMTTEQLKAASVGRTEKLDLGSPLNVYDAAVRKARAIEISFHAEAEARQKGQELLAKAENGQINTEDAVSQLTAMMDGYSKTLSNISPDASYKFRASIATIGSRIVDRVAEKEAKRQQLTTQIKLNSNYQTFLQEVAMWSEGNLSLIDDSSSPTGARQLRVSEAVEQFKSKFLLEVSQLGSPELYNQYASRIDNDIFEAKANVITMGVIEKDKDIGGDAFAAMTRLMTGNGGKYQEVFNSMTRVQQASMRVKIHNAFTEMVSLNNADRAMAKQKDEDAARNLLASYFAAPDSKVLDNLMQIAISTGAVSPEYVASLPQKVTEMRPINATAEMRLKDEINMGAIANLNEFLMRGRELGISDIRLSKLFDYMNPAESRINSNVERDARLVARLAPNTPSTYRQTEDYIGHQQAVEEEFKRKRNEWEAGGRKGAPPTKDAISSRIVFERRQSPLNTMIRSIESDLSTKYGPEGNIRKTNIDFKSMTLKYDESSGSAIGLSEDSKNILMRNGFTQAQINDVEDLLRGRDMQQKQLNTIRLPQ